MLVVCRWQIGYSTNSFPLIYLDARYICIYYQLNIENDDKLLCLKNDFRQNGQDFILKRGCLHIPLLIFSTFFIVPRKVEKENYLHTYYECKSCNKSLFPVQRGTALF